MSDKYIKGLKCPKNVKNESLYKVWIRVFLQVKIGKFIIYMFLLEKNETENSQQQKYYLCGF